MDQPTVVVVGAGAAPPEAQPPSEPGPSAELEQAQRFGELLEAHRQLQEKIMLLESRIESASADRQEIAALRSEVARLVSMLAEVEEEIEEEQAESDLTIVTPEPEPIEPEPPPPPPKKSLIERILST